MVQSQKQQDSNMTTTIEEENNNSFSFLLLGKKFIEVCKTAFVFPFGAIKELVDNSKDAVARRIGVSFVENRQTRDLFFVVRDDGHGIRARDMRSQMHTVGSVKPAGAIYNDSPTGRNGVGFKHACYALGETFLLATHSRGDGSSSICFSTTAKTADDEDALAVNIVSIDERSPVWSPHARALMLMFANETGFDPRSMRCALPYNTTAGDTAAGAQADARKQTTTSSRVIYDYDRARKESCDPSSLASALVDRCLVYLFRDSRANNGGTVVLVGNLDPAMPYEVVRRPAHLDTDWIEPDRLVLDDDDNNKEANDEKVDDDMCDDVCISPERFRALSNKHDKEKHLALKTPERRYARTADDMHDNYLNSLHNFGMYRSLHRFLQWSYIAKSNRASAAEQYSIYLNGTEIDVGVRFHSNSSEDANGYSHDGLVLPSVPLTSAHDAAMIGSSVTCDVRLGFHSADVRVRNHGGLPYGFLVYVNGSLVAPPFLIKPQKGPCDRQTGSDYGLMAQFGKGAMVLLNLHIGRIDTHRQLAALQAIGLAPHASKTGLPDEFIQRVQNALWSDSRIDDENGVNVSVMQALYNIRQVGRQEVVAVAVSDDNNNDDDEVSGDGGGEDEFARKGRKGSKKGGGGAGSGEYKGVVGAAKLAEYRRVRPADYGVRWAPLGEKAHAKRRDANGFDVYYDRYPDQINVGAREERRRKLAKKERERAAQQAAEQKKEAELAAIRRGKRKGPAAFVLVSQPKSSWSLKKPRRFLDERARDKRASSAPHDDDDIADGDGFGGRDDGDDGALMQFAERIVAAADMTSVVDKNGAAAAAAANNKTKKSDGGAKTEIRRCVVVVDEADVDTNVGGGGSFSSSIGKALRSGNPATVRRHIYELQDKIADIERQMSALQRSRDKHQEMLTTAIEIFETLEHHSG